MIESVQFKNFKALRDTTLPLGPFTLIVGPNNSGKSTALEGIRIAARRISPDSALTTGLDLHKRQEIVIKVRCDTIAGPLTWQTQTIWERGAWKESSAALVSAGLESDLKFHCDLLARMPIYRLDPTSIALPVTLEPEMRLSEKGGNLAGVLDRLRDKWPECFDRLNAELHRWLPEFDRVLFNTLSEGRRGFSLRQTRPQMEVPASQLSEGTLMALALLVVAYLPDSPCHLAIEEPDRGIHPRLLRQVQEALYRLSYPEQFGETREPVQVIVTTHSPYFLDLFRDHPEEVVIAEKLEDNVRFQRLTDREDFEEIMGDTPLGEAWYSGILGGVPAGT